jgi:hypothetical protein
MHKPGQLALIKAMSHSELSSVFFSKTEKFYGGGEVEETPYSFQGHCFGPQA